MGWKKWTSKIYALTSIVSWWTVWYLNGIGKVNGFTEVVLLGVLIPAGFAGTMALIEYGNKNERRGHGGQG